jgi:transcriptional regulator with XRE-family HTH domain
MLPIKSPPEVATELAQRVRLRRLRRGWTQTEIARRAGVNQSTYVVFERYGRVSFLRLLKILDVLGLLEEVDRVGRSEDLSTMTLDDLVKPERKRGHRKLE